MGKRPVVVIVVVVIFISNTRGCAKGRSFRKLDLILELNLACHAVGQPTTISESELDDE